ncbi:MAG: translocation/assembly module TamB, partial [Bacteroidaceae bacterium]|nr:translocation/assembly module TamB [Bacteroidaceae bacterium]
MDIQRIKLGIFNRVIIDGIKLYDKQDTLMLDVARLAAKVEILPLLENKIRIDNAQLFGTKATLYKQNADEAANFQFVLDAFKSKDTTTNNPIDLKIGRLLVRRVNIRFDQMDRPHTPGKFTPHHLHINDLGFNVSVKHLTPDSINAELRRFSMSENSGFTLSHFGFKVLGGSTKAELKDFSMKLPDTELSLPLLTAKYDSLPEKDRIKEWFKSVRYDGTLDLNACPKDISAFIPKLKYWNSKISLTTEFQSENGILEINNLKVNDAQQNVSLELDGEVDYNNNIT